MILVCNCHYPGKYIYIYIYGPFIQGITEKILKNISKQKWDYYFGTPKKERPIF